METGIVKIRGKDYRTVAMRVQAFREVHPDWAIETEFIYTQDEVLCKCVIKDPDGRVISCAHAEENRKRGNINPSNAVENCETSAVGRALAFLGLGGTQIVTDEDIAKARRPISPDQLKVLEHRLESIEPRDREKVVESMKQWAGVGDLSELPADLYLTAEQTLKQKAEAYQ